VQSLKRLKHHSGKAEIRPIEGLARLGMSAIACETPILGQQGLIYYVLLTESEAVAPV
jgi:hypothetical protein